jgi:transcriptional regulator with XRE-family HTH domain
MDLARRTGFTQAHISNFLSRKRGLKLGALDGMVKAVGLTIYDLFGARALGRFAAPVESEANYVDVPLVDAKAAATTGRIVQLEHGQA